MLGTIFDTTSSMLREGVVGIHALLNAVQGSDLSAFPRLGLSLIADAICRGHDARAGGVATSYPDSLTRNVSRPPSQNVVVLAKLVCYGGERPPIARRLGVEPVSRPCVAQALGTIPACGRSKRVDRSRRRSKSPDRGVNYPLQPNAVRRHAVCQPHVAPAMNGQTAADGNSRRCGQMPKEAPADHARGIRQEHAHQWWGRRPAPKRIWHRPLLSEVPA